MLAVSSGTALTADDSFIADSFTSFCRNWMEGKKFFNPKNIVCQQVDQLYVAEYTKVSDIFEARVKKTKYAAAPYVGILKYNELTFRSCGGTYEKALQGGFSCSGQYPVTELFRYANGRWEY